MNNVRGIGNAMTKRELIEALEAFGDDDYIVMQQPSGDYWHTQLGKPITGAEMVVVEYSDYHDTMKIVMDEDGYFPDQIDDTKQARVIALS